MADNTTSMYTSKIMADNTMRMYTSKISRIVRLLVKGLPMACKNFEGFSGELVTNTGLKCWQIRRVGSLRASDRLEGSEDHEEQQELVGFWRRRDP